MSSIFDVTSKRYMASMIDSKRKPNIMNNSLERPFLKYARIETRPRKMAMIRLITCSNK